MPQLILRRLALCVVQMILLSLLVFVLSEFMPGDALTGKINPNLTGAQLLEMREKMGLNRPWSARYISWLAGAVRGEFGMSYTHKTAVAKLVGEKFINTLILGMSSLIVCFGVSIPMGAIAGRRHGQFADNIISGGSYALMSMPQAVFGVLVIFMFSYMLPWFPSGGSINPAAASQNFLAQAASRAHHIVLPALTSAMFSIPVLIQLVRSEVITNQNADSIMSLRARGISENRIFWVHILRNSMIPVASLSGGLMAAVLGGTVLVESIFSYPGIGKLFVDSVLGRDYPVANFLILLSGLIAVSGTLLSDILLNRLDPRIRMH